MGSDAFNKEHNKNCGKSSQQLLPAGWKGKSNKSLKNIALTQNACFAHSTGNSNFATLAKIFVLIESD